MIDNVHSITVADGKVYISGMYDEDGQNKQPCYLVNGMRIDLPYIKDEWAGPMTVSEGKVYIGGWHKRKGGVYWVDGIRNEIRGRVAYINSIAVWDGRVYLAGTYKGVDGNLKACYWIDGKRINLSGGTRESSADSLVVMDGDVYIAGSYEGKDGNYKGCYWINGTRTDIPGGIFMYSIYKNFRL
jgi:hypothetical protein